MITPCRDAPWCVRIVPFPCTGGRTKVRPYVDITSSTAVGETGDRQLVNVKEVCTGRADLHAISSFLKNNKIENHEILSVGKDTYKYSYMQEKCYKSNIFEQKIWSFRFFW